MRCMHAHAHAHAHAQDEEFREALNTLVSAEAREGRPLNQSEWPEPLRRVVVLPDDALPMQRMVLLAFCALYNRRSLTSSVSSPCSSG